MSLDVYLEADEPFASPAHQSGIFIRHEGRTLQITRDQWDFLNPGREPASVEMPEETDTLFRANITHNLGKMAEVAGIYEALWRPDEIGITHAAQLVSPLAAGLGKLISDPEGYRCLNPSKWLGKL